jgi:hypothetical protein
VLDLSLGNGTRFDILLLMDDTRLYVGVQGYGCYAFNQNMISGLDASYIGQKLKIAFGDATNLKDFLMAQVASNTTPQGTYCMDYCKR